MDGRATRRRLLTAAAAALVGTAGCSRQSDGVDDGRATASPGDPTSATVTDPDATADPTGSPTTGTEATTTTSLGDVDPRSLDRYPYGVGESRPAAARAATAAAGHGPDDPVEVELLAVQSSPVTDPLGSLASDLRSVGVELSVETVLAPRLPAIRDGEVDAFSLWVPGDYPHPEAFLRAVAPANTDPDDPGADGLPLFWTADADHGPGRPAAVAAFDRIRAARSGEDPAVDLAAQYRLVERAAWVDVPAIPTAHPTEERLWRPEVDYRPPGAMARAASTARTVAGADGETVTLLTDRVRTLDPVRADEPGRSVVADVLDPLYRYPRGIADPEPALVADHATSADGLVHRFELRRDVRFPDGSDLTAADVVYSLRRLAESPASDRLWLLTDALGVVHRRSGDETDPVVPGSLAVRAVGDRAVEVELADPHPAVPAVLADPACSVVPAGAVGDVEGYDGRRSRRAFARRPVGTGPYRVASADLPGSVTVERSPAYRGDPAPVERVRRITRDVATPRAPASPVPSGTDPTVVDALRQGVVDVVDPRLIDDPDEAGTDAFDPDRLRAVEAGDRGRTLGRYPLGGESAGYARVPAVETALLGFDCRRVPLPVRRAVAFVLNRRAYVRTAHDGRRRPAYHLTPPAAFPGGPAAYRRHYR